MLVAALEEVQAQRDDCILASFVQTEHTHSVLLGAVPEQFIDLQSGGKVGVTQRLHFHSTTALTLSHGVGFILDRTLARLCTVLSKQNLLFISITAVKLVRKFRNHSLHLEPDVL